MQRRRNRRADSIAAAPGGAEAVFRAAVSDAGLRAIWSVVPKSAWPSDDPDHRPAALAAWSEARLFHVATAVSRIRDSAALPSSATWRPVAIESQDGSDRLSGVPVRIGSAVGGLRLDRMLVDLLSSVPAGDGLSVLTLVVEATGLPERVSPNLRADPLLPTNLAMVSPASSFASSGLYSPAARVHPSDDCDLLPGFGRAVHGPVLPLALYDLTASPDSPRRTSSADLALRIWVEAVCLVMHRDWPRACLGPVYLQQSLRSFLGWFYGPALPSPRKYWRRLLRAAAALDSRAAWFPYRDPVTGAVNVRKVVSFLELPLFPLQLDDPVSLVVWLPPGSRTGPPVDRAALRYWGRRSQVAYRALLALAYHWFRPGVNRFELYPGNWRQSYDPCRYEPYSPQRLVELCYPTSSARNRRVLYSRARAAVERLAEAGDVQLDGDRILPPRPGVAKHRLNGFDPA